MITIMGATGKTGGVAARVLLEQGEKVRVISRSKDAVRDLVARGAQAALGEAADAAFLARAFRGSDAVYTLIPPDPSSADFPAQQDRVGEATAQAISDSGVHHVAFLSSLGAELPSGTGPITGLYRQEKRLAAIPGVNVLTLRAGYFFENHYFLLGLIKHQGIAGSAIAGDVPLAQVATEDIGVAAAQALRARDFRGFEVRELLGPRDLTLDETTRIIAAAIGKPDLKYVRFPYDAALDGMVTAGLSKSVASLYVEMSKAFNERRVRSVEGRNARNTTPTPFEDFATDVLAPAYRAM
jgi:uncharacterized protein YbjT (DUF2867 family)